MLEEEALEAVADKAIERNIGARGLRAVMEGLLTPIMYEIPSDPSIEKVVITAEYVRGEKDVELIRSEHHAQEHVKQNAGESGGAHDEDTEKNASAS